MKMSNKVRTFLSRSMIVIWFLLFSAMCVFLYREMSMWFRGVSIGVIVGSSVTAVIMAVFYFASGGEEFYNDSK